MKFTEEQYQKIIDAWDSQIIYKSATQSVIDELEIGYLNMGDQALAIANPLTREWAHDEFVEKEKEFYWKLKDNLEFGLASDGIVINIGLNKKSKLTESIIKAWGYNPEMFDREEV